MQLLNLASGVDTYLPYDYAPSPFGDAFTSISSAAGTPWQTWTVKGYTPTNGDRVQLFQGAGGSLDAAFTAGQLYYVISASGDTFSVSATSGGAAVSGQVAQSTGINVIVHKSALIIGTVQPFKPGYTVVVMNLTGTNATLQGATDTGQSSPGGVYNPPAGPGSYSTLATVNAGTAALVQLSTDWIKAVSSGLVLLQN